MVVGFAIMLEGAAETHFSYFGWPPPHGVHVWDGDALVVVFVAGDGVIVDVSKVVVAGCFFADASC